MHPVLIIVIFALGTWFLLALGLATESWEWKHGIEFHLAVPDWGRGVWNRVPLLILVLIILGTLGTLGYVVANPKGKAFTEFYVLGISGKAMDYPKKLGVGEEGMVIVGIVNRENEPVTYRVEVVIDGIKNKEMGLVMLEHGEEWKEVVGFTTNRVGDNQKVEFLLYRQGQSEVYQWLHLWVDVR